jgi:hypothetical protein
MIVKFILIAIILEIVMNLLTPLLFGQILWISLAVTVISYLVGDLLILSISNNTIATLADVGIAWIVIYMFNSWSYYGSISVTNALISAICVGIGEWFFHKYIAKTVLTSRKKEV